MQVNLLAHAACVDVTLPMHGVQLLFSTPKHVVAEAHKAALLRAVHTGQLSPVEGQARWAALAYFSGRPDQQLAFDAMQVSDPLVQL